MRPKKRILLFDEDGPALGVRAFCLETRGYLVLQAQTVAEATEIILGCDGRVDVAVVDAGSRDLRGIALAAWLRLRVRELPVLLVSQRLKLAQIPICAANVILPKDCCTPLDVLERVRLMAARKRGPRKRPVMSVQVIAAQSAERVGCVMGTLSDLPGVKAKELTAANVKTWQEALTKLRSRRAIIAANDNGSITAWRDDDGNYRAEFHRLMAKKGEILVPAKDGPKGLEKWFRTWWPQMTPAPFDPVDNLLKAVAAWVDFAGGNAIVVGGIDIQKWPLDDEFKFFVAVKCTGRRPTLEKGGA